jgi:hypothetical protein
MNKESNEMAEEYPTASSLVKKNFLKFEDGDWWAIEVTGVFNELIEELDKQFINKDNEKAMKEAGYVKIDKYRK